MVSQYCRTHFSDNKVKYNQNYEEYENVLKILFFLAVFKGGDETRSGYVWYIPVI